MLAGNANDVSGEVVHQKDLQPGEGLLRVNTALDLNPTVQEHGNRLNGGVVVQVSVTSTGDASEPAIGDDGGVGSHCVIEVGNLEKNKSKTYETSAM